MIALSVGIGLIASFLFTELTGLSAGGLVVPGYLALYLDQPLRVAATFAIALLTHLIVLGLSNIMILYGRRRFMAAVLVGFWLGWVAARFLGHISLPVPEIRVIGYIVPGLIANESLKYGVLTTFGSTLLLSAIVRLILLLAIG